MGVGGAEIIFGRLKKQMTLSHEEYMLFHIYTPYLAYCFSFFFFFQTLLKRYPFFFNTDILLCYHIQNSSKMSSLLKLYKHEMTKWSKIWWVARMILHSNDKFFKTAIVFSTLSPGCMFPCDFSLNTFDQCSKLEQYSTLAV